MKWSAPCSQFANSSSHGRVFDSGRASWSLIRRLGLLILLNLQMAFVRRGSHDPAETDDRRSPVPSFFFMTYAMNIRRPIAGGYLHAGA